MLLFAQPPGEDVGHRPKTETEPGRAGVWFDDASLPVEPGQLVVKYRGSVREPVEAILASGRDLASAIDGGDLGTQ